MKWAPWVIGLAGLGVVAYGLWLQRVHPPRITGTSSIDVTNPRTGQRLRLRTRTIEGGGFTRTEVELPGGTWLDCVSADCAETVRAEFFELFDTLRDQRP
mgnify:CR=1 FL=1